MTDECTSTFPKSEYLMNRNTIVQEKNTHCYHLFHPYVTNGFSHPYHLDESTFIFRGVWSNFLILFSFFDENPVSKQKTPRCDSTISHLGLFCLPMSHKRMPGLYGLIIVLLCGQN